MIVQGILDFFGQWIGGMVRLIPGLPPEVLDALSDLNILGSELAVGLAAFGILVPFDVINGIIVAWTALMTVWLAYMVVRLVTWLF